jgi:beta-hydroxylase
MNFYRYEEVFPFLEDIKRHGDRILAEVESVPADMWTPWPEKGLYKDGGWRIIPYKGFGMTIEKSRKLTPFTYDLVMGIPGIVTAVISRIPPGTEVTPHRGWAELANRVLRCHYVLQTNRRCSLTVGGETRRVRKGHVIVFDDSKLHCASNTGETDKIVVIMDFPRPEGCPRGESSAEKTPALMDFLAACN